MYCSSCGSAVTKGLRFCNHCGANLGKIRDEPLISSIVALFIFGLGGNIGLIAVLKEILDLDTRLIIGFSLLVFLMMFVLEGVLLSLLLSRRRATREATVTERSTERSTNELGEGQPRVLPGHMPGVTEHTTRSFEPSFVDRNSK